jgi:serine/threonine-protein kinase
MTSRQQKLQIAALERIDDICAEFERQWQTDSEPSIASMLNTDLAKDEQRVLLTELVLLDLDYRRRRGESPEKQTYLDHFSDDALAVNAAFAEGDQRNKAFEPPTIARLSSLFPGLEVMELVGAGGMGAVYKARQAGLDRVVALKVLPEEFADDVKFALRFTREARTLARLTHPNIVSVFEFGNVEDTYYFLMEFVDGSTLRDVVAARQLSPQHALTIVPHLCDALQYAHDRGVIHRDIKPENILIARDGSVKIADFGLSRILGDEGQNESLTGTHQVMGTVRYMAPEQLEGARSVDHRADIYSLGVVFYEMLTGELPIGRFELPSRKVEVDVRLDDVVLRTLEKEPLRRYQRASQLKSDVQSITSNGDPAFAPTVTESTSSDRSSGATAQNSSLAEQELAGRMLLTRRSLVERVEQSLKPLFRGQLVQILFGIALIALGAQCWARNTDVTHRLVSGLIVHVYGILVIAQAAWVCTKMRLIDYSKPVSEIRQRLELLQTGYLRSGILVGFAWWLMWMPAGVAFGFDVVLQQRSLIPGLLVGIPGLLISVWLFLRAAKSRSTSEEPDKSPLVGGSIRAAYRALEEMESANIG